MLRSIQSLRNFTMRATDGEIGKVKDFYFDDHTWTLRYLVVETGNWLFGRKVLISTAALQAPDWDSHSFPVNLTTDQVKHSPDINTERPISSQHQNDLNSHYSWPGFEGGIGFMTTGMVGGVIAPGVAFEDQIAHEMHQADDSQPKTDKHLRSFKQVAGYRLQASDEEIGEVEDFMLDDSSWSIPYFVIQTGSWYEGKMILASTKFADNIDWENSAVYLLQSPSSLKNSPEFDYTEPVPEEYLQRISNDYTRRDI